MTEEAGLPETGTIEIVAPDEAAQIVEEVAHDIPASVGHRILIALDVDGTVLLEDESPSPGVVEAVEDAQRAGHEIMIATGRNWASTEGVLRTLGITPEYVVCANGAVVMKRTDQGEYERVHTETFDPTAVLDLLRVHMPEAHFVVEMPDGDRRFTDYMDAWNLDGARRVAFEDLAREPVSRVVVVAPKSSPEDFMELVHSIGLTQVSYSVGWTAWLDIAPDGVDKGTALELVREWLGFDPAHVLVVGDGRNDLGMFEWALRNGGRAIAMAQGTQDVRDAAGETTLSVHEGGVAAILRAL